MKRRDLLAAVGVSGSLAGCLGVLATPNDIEGSSDGEMPIPDPPDDVQRVITLIDQDSPAYDLDIEVQLKESIVTPEHTASIRMTIINDGAPRFLRGLSSGIHPFRKFRGGSIPAGLWLHSRGRHKSLAEANKRDGQWARERVPESGLFSTAEYVGPQFVDTRESVELMYFVWDDLETDPYMELGQYRFEGSISIHEKRWEKAMHVLN